MVFSSYLFIFYFLPPVVLIYFLAPKILKNLVLIIASLFFYTWGAPDFVLSLLLFCALDYCFGLAIQRTVSSSRAKQLLTISLLINISALAYFKYANFFIHEVNRAILAFGLSPIAWTKIALPIGISFFTFHKISYVVDIYRKIRPACSNPIDFLLYILFFPQLIAGPIIRYHEIEQQLKERRSRLNDVFEGLVRFSIGLAKKVLIADVVGHTADQMFALKLETLATPYAWIGIVAYTAQIYFDFSGYSDMAIGLARIFGFHFPENFNQPYLARNFTDFWRRWHMSFSRWMREYLYYPLGGSRCSSFRNYINLWIIFIFSGFWHGSEWTFVLWGIFHGFFITLDKLFLLRLTEKLPVFIQVLSTLFLVMISRVLFRADNLDHAWMYTQQLFAGVSVQKFIPLGMLSSHYELFMIGLAYSICLWRLLPGLEEFLKFIWQTRSTAQRTAFKGIWAALMLFLSAVSMAGTDFSPFIYFQF